MFLVNSRLGLFTAAGSLRLPLSRSYGVNLPSSLTTLLPIALGFSPHLPVSVCGTGALDIPHTFSRHKASGTSLLVFGPFRPGRPTPRSPYLHVSVCLNLQRLRNFNRMCIDYASRPRLSSRLTLGGRTFPRKPLIFGHYDSHIILATHSGILTPIQSTCPSDHASPRIRRSPTQHCVAQASVICLAPLNFPRRTTRPVSYYALF